jgi:hypothetical protein
MPGMNPIIATLVKLIEAKQQDATLAQRKSESDAENSFRMEQVKHLQDALAHEKDVAKAHIEFQHATARQAVAEQFRREAAAGTQEVDTMQGLPQQTGFQDVMQPGEKVPYVSQQPTFGAPSEIPFGTQIADSEFGPVTVKGVVPYEKMLSRHVTQAQLEAGIKALTAGMEAQAKLPSQLALENRKGANAREVANINQTGRETISDNQIASQERINGSRNATALAVAQIRAKGQSVKDTAALSPIVESVYLGETKVPVGNNGIAVIRGIKSLGGAVPDPTLLKKVPYVNTMLDIANRVEAMIPKLATNQAGAKIKGAVTAVWPTDLANEYKTMGIDATMAAREAGEKGNFSNTDIGRAYAALIDPGITQEQAKLKLNVLRTKIYNKLMDESLAGLGDKQKLAILGKYNINPETIPIKTSQGTKPRYIFGQKTQTWGVYDSKIGGYKGVE